MLFWPGRSVKSGLINNFVTSFLQLERVKRMKKLILLLPCTIFPYSLFMGLYHFIKGMGNLGESFSFLPWLFIVSFICNVIFLVLSIHQKWDCKKIALLNMVIKIVQIPAYVAVFLLGVFSFGALFTIGLAVVFFLFDCASIFLSGLIGITSVIRCYTDRIISKRFSIINGLLQFVFCADVISSIIIFMQANCKHKPVSHNI